MPCLSELSELSEHPAFRLAFGVAGAACFGTFVLWRSIHGSLELHGPPHIPSPRDAAMPALSEDEVRQLPYPSDALPGARDVQSPYGSTRVYEWGPADGRRLLLIHGISTPSIALTGLAYSLVERGYRVMLFDLFGRGYSSGPSPSTHQYDSALYTSQILLCLQSSPIPWTSFTLIGYSLGGAIAADFTSYFPNLVEGLVLVASGGLIRTEHISWKSRLLYSTGGLLPESLIERLVAKRLWTGPVEARSIEPEIATASTSSSSDHDEPKGGLRSHAVYTSSNIVLLPENPYSTVSHVVDWQIIHHQGFIPAFISSIRYAPIHNQHQRWKKIADNIRNGTGKLNQVWLVLGEIDPIIIADELVEDAQATFGEDIVHIKIVKGSGHEVAIDRASEIVDVVEQML
ncbi:alpha/beta-hydrolase [Massarina eburnea CBS 473.64]|uniref:Alpha/beta-hydrolase n=1 Tax=Massarina eburnea CBS 473.64 TaxID=1395130 RepID=A0A6A6S6H9_9PLEO|nr:alpha/beta-hydrolase [Massarina eburnea CBS 473.64]